MRSKENGGTLYAMERGLTRARHTQQSRKVRPRLCCKIKLQHCCVLCPEGAFTVSHTHDRIAEDSEGPAHNSASRMLHHTVGYTPSIQRGTPARYIAVHRSTYKYDTASAPWVEVDGRQCAAGDDD